MKLGFMLAAFGVGLGLALHLAMNAAVGVRVVNPRMGNALFWCIGAIAALAVGVSGFEKEFWSRAAAVPAVLWTAGAMGACLVFGVAYLIPRLGAGTFTVVLLAGQVIGGLIIAHYGALGSPVERFSFVRCLGVVVMLAGASLAVLGKVPFLK